MKTWFITGATGGLATAVVQQVLARGDRVAVTTHRAGALAELKTTYGDQLWESTLNLQDPAEVQQVVRKAFHDLGTIDVLLNNAAYGIYGPVESINAQQTSDVMAINLFGSLNTARAFLPFFRQQGHGQIVQISSMAGEFSGPGMGIYSASKYAVEAAVEAMAAEVAPFNVHTTLVEPGGIRTGFGVKGAFGAELPAYAGTPADNLIKYIKGAGQRADAEKQLQRIAGDPQKMAATIVQRVDQGEGPLRMTMGSDAYNSIHASLTARLAALEDQKNLAYATDADGFQAGNPSNL